MIKQYTIHRISIFSLFKIGGIVGFVLSFIPITITIFTVLYLVNILVDWMTGMVYQLSLPIPLLGDIGLDINVVELLHLESLFAQLQNIAMIGGFSGVLLALFLSLLAAIFWGLIAVLSGVIFNLLSKAAGGIQVSMSEESMQVTNEIQASPTE